MRAATVALLVLACRHPTAPSPFTVAAVAFAPIAGDVVRYGDGWVEPAGWVGADHELAAPLRIANGTTALVVRGRFLEGLGTGRFDVQLLRSGHVVASFALAPAAGWQTTAFPLDLPAGAYVVQVTLRPSGRLSDTRLSWVRAE